MADTKTAMAEAVDERIRFIMANRERFLEAWIAETGLLPSECELVEEMHPSGKIVVYCRKR